VYEEPKEVIRHVATLEPTGYDDENSLCCGGSLGNIMLSHEKRRGIAEDVTAKLTANDPDSLITACPLCKKTLAQATSTRVVDIAELVAEAIADAPALKKNPSRHKKKIVRESAASL
jgi:Fe-S oxidoreductase